MILYLILCLVLLLQLLLLLCHRYLLQKAIHKGLEGPTNILLQV
jgi:hypothetical protein